MKKSALIKLIPIVICLLFLLTVYCKNLLIDFPDFYKIDAVSSASHDIRVDSGKAYRDYAVFETYHKDSYNYHWITYSPSTVKIFVDTMIVADTPRVVICTLSNLKPNTRYDFTFGGDFKTTTPEERHMVDGTFHTAR